MEELACDFLPGADLREGTVKGSVEVDGACLLRRREQFLTFIHAGHLTSPPSRGALCLIRNLYLRVRWTATADGRSILPISIFPIHTAAVVAATISGGGERAWFDGTARHIGMGRDGRGSRRVPLRQRPARTGHELSAEGSHDLAAHSPAVARNTVRSLRSGRVHAQ